ncbi:MAG: hypothetical protein A2289_14850 [Deltaproteobacteria bacterium RIFOXYA12_FULL_58_15]|nr:MAG: hypothetical protein A2289_14850 [Deltaproteobacteria bacterium RIFOXYA12_FULL_58_15]OGR09763.1 MAG: hypothetical protein A2341_13200 [Deltaproteobacteria bacterium RIFOXYB12_FULL_58_9]
MSQSAELLVLIYSTPNSLVPPARAVDSYATSSYTHEGVTATIETCCYNLLALAAVTAYLFHNGPIYSMANGRMGDGVLLTHGSTTAYVGPKENLPTPARFAIKIDLDGRALFPGFCDSHLHLVVASLEHRNLDCRRCGSIEELQALIRDRAACTRPGDWIIGSGWERRVLFADARPSPAALDVAAPENPVLLVSKDWHSLWLNAAGMTHLLALPQLPACTIEQQRGAYTGLVYEEVFALRNLLLPKPSQAAKAAALAPYIEHLWRHGITRVHTMEAPEDLPIVANHLENSQARIRVIANLLFASPAELRANAVLLQGNRHPWLDLGGVKLFVDGSFGSLTAALSIPYLGTNSRGLLALDAVVLDDWLRAMVDAKTNGVFHSIGDRATRLVVDGLARYDWPAATRHRIEHVQLLPSGLGDYRGLVLSGQPSHLWADREIILRHLSANLHEYCYAYRLMLEGGAELVFGSDAPVETVDPWPGIRAAVTRVATGTSAAFVHAQALTLEEALAAHTSTPGRLNNFPFATGVLQVGAAADLVVLDRDPFQSTRDETGKVRLDDEAWQIRTDMTWVNGELVYTR